jgi:hypothetical protein
VDVEPVPLDLNKNPFIGYEQEAGPGVWGFEFLWLNQDPIWRVNRCNAMKAALDALIAEAMEEITKGAA